MSKHAREISQDLRTRFDPFPFDIVCLASETQYLKMSENCVCVRGITNVVLERDIWEPIGKYCIWVSEVADISILPTIQKTVKSFTSRQIEQSVFV